MKNNFKSSDIDMLEVCRMLCDYGDMLYLDFIVIEMFSFTTIKLDYADIKDIVIIDNKYLQINTYFGNIFIEIDNIEKIEIE